MKVVVPISWASLGAQTVKNLLSMQKTQVWTLGQEEPLEKGMGTHSSILAWRITWTEETGGLQSMKLQRIGYDWATNTHRTYLIGLLWRVNESMHIMLLSQCFGKSKRWQMFSFSYYHCHQSSSHHHYHCRHHHHKHHHLTISIIPEW